MKNYMLAVVLIIFVAIIICFAFYKGNNDIKHFKFYSNVYSKNGNNFSILCAFGIKKNGTKFWSPIVIVPEKNARPVLSFDGFNFSIKIKDIDISVSNNNFYFFNSIGGFEIYPAPVGIEVNEENVFSVAADFLNTR